MSVSANCGALDHLVFHNEGHIAYGLTITDNMKEVSNIPWDQQTPPGNRSEPILSTDLAYRVLWPLSTSDLNNDKQLEQTPGYEDDVE